MHTVYYYYYSSLNSVEGGALPFLVGGACCWLILIDIDGGDGQSILWL